MKYLKYILSVLGVALVATLFLGMGNNNHQTLGAPVATIMRSILPETDNTYDLGSTTPAAEWKNVYTKNLTVSGTCTGCGSGSAFAWTPTSYGNSNSTLLQFLEGFMSNSS